MTVTFWRSICRKYNHNDASAVVGVDQISSSSDDEDVSGS
jgi:hypothetical protein